MATNITSDNVKSISDLTAISSADIATDDLLLLQDVSANALKKVTASEITKKTTKSNGLYKGTITDCNDIIAGESGATNASTANAPCTYGAVNCYDTYGGTVLIQICVDTTNNVMYTRKKVSGTWSSWQKLVTESDLTPTTTQITFASGTTNDSTGCNYSVSGKICIVSISTWTPSAQGVAVANKLPKAKHKAIVRFNGSNGTYGGFYINADSTTLMFGNSPTSQTYNGQIMYTIAD